jgi:hypothetical protein
MKYKIRSDLTVFIEWQKLISTVEKDLLFNEDGQNSSIRRIVLE